MTKFEEKISHLIDLLLEKTDEGKVSWESTANSDTFISSLGLYGISIGRRMPESSLTGMSVALYGARPTTYVLSFLDDSGETFDSKVEESRDSDDYEKLEELFTCARRSAHNVGESLERLLQELESR